MPRSVRTASSTALLIGDILTSAAVFGFFFVHCLVASPRKKFWTDEVLTLVTLRGTTFKQMIASLLDTINAMPPTYFVCIWPWAKVFGTSEFALRMFSSLFMGLAWLFCWLLLRTFCSRLTATTATFVTMLCSEEILVNSIEARCYSMYVAAFVAASWLFVLSARPRISVWIGIGAFVAHTFLVTTHYIGNFYSGGLIIAALVAWMLTGERGLRSYVIWSFFGAATTVISIPFYLAQRSLGGRDNWLQAPSVGSLLKFYTFGSVVIHSIVLLIAGCIVVKVVFIDKAWKGRTAAEAARALNPLQRDDSDSRMLCIALLCLGSLLLPFGVWIESHIGFRLFLPRYFLPSFIVWPCLLGACLEGGIQWSHGRRLRRFSMFSPLMSCGAMIGIALFVLSFRDSPRNGRGVQEMQRIAAAMKEHGLDFVSSYINVFVPAWHYAGHSTEHLKYVRLMDRKEKFRKLGQNCELRIIDTLESRFWPGITISPEQLQERQGRFLMLAEDFDECFGEGRNPHNLHVAEKLGDDIVVVER